MIRIEQLKIQFENSSGQRLAARLETPYTGAKHYAIFAHCFTCSKDIAAASRISRSLAQLGFAVLRFDFTGLGNSEGDFANSNFSSNVDDIVAAARFLAQEYVAPSLLIGHSLGGTAVLVAANRLPSVQAVCTISAPFQPEHVIENFAADLSTIETDGQATVSLAGRSFTIKKQLLDDLRQYQSDQAIGKLGRALLVFHSPQDKIVGIDNAKQIYEAARHPKSFISLDGADHLLTKRNDSEYVAQTLAAWVRRYLTDTPEALDSQALETAELGEHDAIVQDIDHSLTHRLMTRDHQYVADEPAELGGHNQGPAPYQLLLWSLGACTAMTIRMYANRKQWALRSIKVKLTHKKIRASEYYQDPALTGQIDFIDRQITVSGDLDSQQQFRLHEIADKCPVHRTLREKPQIKTSLELSTEEP